MIIPLCALAALFVTAPLPAAKDPLVLRVAGAPDAETVASGEGDDRVYRAGPCRVTTALPVGYPRPTPPGAVEIKRYPTVRRAAIDGGGVRDDGMWGLRTAGAFWPLFRHIEERGIAMTAPVETEYEGLTSDDPAEAWRMAFLYRTPELGPTGADGRIEVADAPATTVLAVGVRGDLSPKGLRRTLALLESWLAERDDWEVAGPPRTLGYNGPDVRGGDRWWEVQIPIRPVADPA